MSNGTPKRAERICIQRVKFLFPESSVNLPRMKRMATWSGLLLLLVSVQVYAGMCGVRCGVMRSAISHNSMSAMPNCRDMSSHQSTKAGVMLMAPHNCSSKICQSDLQLFQNPTGHDVEGLVQPVRTVSFSGFPALVLLQNAGFQRLRVDRSTQSIPPFDPLISGLRI
jgi:hypothetical protein